MPGGTAIWNEPSSRLATMACQPESDLVAPRTGMNWMLDAGSGRSGPRLGDLAADENAAGELDVRVALDRPLGPREFVLLDQVRLAAGGEGASVELSPAIGLIVNRPWSSARNLAVK